MKKVKKFFKWVGIVFGALIVLGVIANLTGNNDKPKETAKVEQVVKKEDEAAKKKKEEDAKLKAEVEKIKKEQEAKKKAEEEKAKKIAAEEKINIGMDAETFEHNWATLSGDVGGDIVLKNPEANIGKVKDTKTYDLTDNASIVVTLHKGNHMINEVTVITMPSKSDVANAEILLSYAIAIGATNMNLVPDERGEIFKALMDQNPNLEEKDVWYTKGNLKYGLLISKQTGMWLNIKHVNAK